MRLFSVIFKHCVKSGPMIISMVVLLVSLMRRFFDPSNHSLCAQMKMIAAIIITTSTVFENHRRSLIQHCERRVLRLHLESESKMPKKNWSIFASFVKPEGCGQTALPTGHW